VYVTHDQVEAMTVGQKIILLNKGKIQMAGTPEEIYHHPVNIFTATFIGSPAMNILLSHYEDHKLFTENGLAVPINEDLQKQIEGHGNPNILLGIRPEKIRVCPEATDRSLPVKINYMEDYGSRLCLFFDVNGKNYSIIVDSLSARIGDTIQVEFPDEDLVLFDGETGENIMGYQA
jgi:ABC-type sugar transport system ATPase subunit